MAMLEVDLDEFNTVDLLDEVVKRMRGGMHNVSNKEWQAIKENFEWLSAHAGWWVMRLESIDDQAKAEILSAAWNKYTSFQLTDKLT